MPPRKRSANSHGQSSAKPLKRRPLTDNRREVKYYGIMACLALWQRRPHDIIRLYLDEALISRFAPVLQWAASKRKAYHIVSAEDLERLTESIHHQGVCILARERSFLEFNDLMGLLRGTQAAQLLVYLDGVENPHNLGAILRTCAHFGIHFLLGAMDRLPKLSAAACRVAEGGAEQVAVVRLSQPLRQLKTLQAQSFQLLATAVHGRAQSLYQHRFASHSVLVLGAEQQGVSNHLLNVADQIIKIPGSGNVESLNVSVAFALCAGEFYRQQFLTSGGHHVL